jgi:hypothetical protein
MRVVDVGIMMLAHSIMPVTGQCGNPGAIFQLKRSLNPSLSMEWEVCSCEHVMCVQPPTQNSIRIIRIIRISTLTSHCVCAGRHWKHVRRHHPRG